MPRPRAPARTPLVSRCTTAPVTRTAPMPTPPTAPATASTLALIGDSAGGTSTTHTCTCNDGYFGDGDTAGTGCTTCTAVANSINVTCVDMYISIVLLAWSLARSDEIDLSAIAVKREILQFVIAYCSLDL